MFVIKKLLGAKNVKKVMTSNVWHCFCTYCTKVLVTFQNNIMSHSILSCTTVLETRPNVWDRDKDQDRGRSETGLVIRPQDWKTHANFVKILCSLEFEQACNFGVKSWGRWLSGLGSQERPKSRRERDVTSIERVGCCCNERVRTTMSTQTLHLQDFEI